MAAASPLEAFAVAQIQSGWPTTYWSDEYTIAMLTGRPQVVLHERGATIIRPNSGTADFVLTDKTQVLEWFG